MGTVSEKMGDLTTDLALLKDDLEADLEEILDHPCHVTIEGVDTETGEVTLRAELDLAELRDRLQAHGGYDDVDIGIDDDFVFRFSPIPDPGTEQD